MQLLQEQSYLKLPESNQSASTALPKPYRHSFIRFVALGMLSTVLLVNNYTFNNPQALQQTIQTQLNINQTKFNMLYSIVAIPNIIFALCIGLIIDYFGIRKSFLILTGCLPLSQLLVAFGGMYKNYTMMLMGRLFFGLIFQSIDIAVSCYVVSWFIGQELGLALGLIVTLPQFGNALNSYATPIIYERTQKLAVPLFVSAGLCVISFCFACVVVYFDVEADEVDKKNNIKVITDLEAQTDSDQKFKLADLKSLHSTFWLISSLCMLAIAQYVPFLDNSNKLLQVRFCYSQVTAGQNITITYIVVGMFGFPLAWFIDRIGFRRYFGMVGMGIFVIGHSIILLYPQCLSSSFVTSWSGVSYGLLMLGVGYCFYANCLYPSIALVVKKKIAGTAFGTMQMLSNFAMAVYPTISASIVQHASTQQQGYRLFSLFFVVTGLVGIVVAFLLFFINEDDKKKLDASSQESNMIKIVYHASWTDTEYMHRKRKKSKAMISGFHSDNDRYDSYQSSENEVEKQRKQFIIEMAKHRASLNKTQRKAKRQDSIKSKNSTKDKAKLQKSKSIKSTKVLFEGEASGQDNDIEEQILKKQKKTDNSET